MRLRHSVWHKHSAQCLPEADVAHIHTKKERERDRESNGEAECDMNMHELQRQIPSRNASTVMNATTCSSFLLLLPAAKQVPVASCH